MSTGTKSTKKPNGKQNKQEIQTGKSEKAPSKSYEEYLLSMSHAPKPNESSHWFQMLIAAFFTAVIIMITRMAIYERPMAQFFWSDNKTQLTDFFSYYKMILILTCAVLVLIVISYRIFTQSFYIKRSFAYIPMIIYTAFVLLSYVLSDYKEFALWGWNDRFEGTLTLLAYMIMLFFLINTVNTENNVKWIIYPIAATGAILSILGLTQALDYDFFRTSLGKKLITPSWFWDQVDNLNFTFQNKEIYQTVYNINYVSFYLTLLIPLFGLLFIRSVMNGKEEALWKKIFWGVLFALLIFNLIGSASSGGLMGMAAVIIMAIILLNKKIIAWWKPITVLLLVAVVIAGLSYERWMSELSDAVGGVLGKQTNQSESGESADVKHKVNYMITSGPSVIISFDGNEIIFTTFNDDPTALKLQDASGEDLSLIPTNISPIYRVEDKRFNGITVRPAQDKAENNFIVVGTNGDEWPFQLTSDGLKYYTGMGKLVDLNKVPSVGWENNQSFGSGRGYIWSRTIPMMKDTLILGHGADTYCIYFPHGDYVGKYNSGTFSSNTNIVVDKPHNMYFGAIVGTGGISLLALLALWGLYLIQSFLIYLRIEYNSFMSYVGAGIFLGICGFLVSGLVNDSSVSVMPMFYGLLGTGIAINMLLKKQRNTNKTAASIN